MRVINLDETGIKLINNKKQQMYLTLDDVKDFVKQNNIIHDNTLEYKNKKLHLSSEETQDFSTIIKYLKS